MRCCLGSNAPRTLSKPQIDLTKVGSTKPKNARFPRILVVDDEKDLRELVVEIAGFLVGPEYQILEANNGRRALEIVKDPTAHIKVILSDIQMPIMDGLTFVSEVRASGGMMPVVFSSAKDMKTEDFAKIDELAPSLFLPKPYEIDQLEVKINQALQMAHQLLKD